MTSLKRNWSYFLTLIFSIGWLYYNYISLLCPVDPGDGIVHFFFSQASWDFPILFLDLWSKPLFTLLTSPFVQLGMGGMIFFNSIVFSLTVIYAWKTLKHLGVNQYFALSFPFFLLLTQDYSNTILGGHTEPLFSLLLVVGIWFWIREKYNFFAIFIGLLLFSRSESQLTVLLAFLLLTYIRQWKALFFLFLPFLIYAIIGLFAFHDFFWYFNRSPYQMGNAIYGVGTYEHYLMSYKNFIGNHGLFLFILALPATILHFIRNEFSIKSCGITFLSYGTFLGVIAAHSYFWGSGQNASMGLTRIATQALPSFLICQFYFLQKTPWKWPKLSNPFAIALTGVLVLYLCTTPYLVKKIKPMELATKELFERNEGTLKGKKILTSSPYFAYLMGENYFLKDSKVKRLNPSYFNPKPVGFDYIIWDSHFGPLESGIGIDQFTIEKGFIVSDTEEIENQKVVLVEVVN